MHIFSDRAASQVGNMFSDPAARWESQDGKEWAWRRIVLTVRHSLAEAAATNF